MTVFLAGTLLSSIVFYYFHKNSQKGLFQLLWETLVWKKHGPNH